MVKTNQTFKVFDEEAFRNNVRRIIRDIKKERALLPNVQKYIYVNSQLTDAIEQLEGAAG